MKVLVFFSLKRKFLNKSTLLLNCLIFLAVGCLFFADKLVEAINPSTMEPLTVYLSHDLYLDMNDFETDDSLWLLKEYNNETLAQKEVKLSRNEEGYQLISAYGVDPMDYETVRYLLSSYQKKRYAKEHDITLLQEVEALSAPVITVKSLHEADALSADRQAVAFFIETSIYFMTLSFCTAIAVEVIYEKTGKILDLILTAVRPRIHFYAKIISGWLAVFLQSGISFLEVLLFYSIRQQYDHGENLLKLLENSGLLRQDAKSFHEFFASFGSFSDLLPSLLLVLLFLFLGILLIQLIMTVLASYVNTMEEGAAIQTPCYLILMLIYYLALTLNSPYQMSEGLGKVLSYLPVFSMLFMPNRIILGVVKWWEVLCSFLLSFLLIVAVLYYGASWYESGILSGKRKKKRSLIETLIRVREALKEE